MSIDVVRCSTTRVEHKSHVALGFFTTTNRMERFRDTPIEYMFRVQPDVSSLCDIGRPSFVRAAQRKQRQPFWIRQHPTRRGFTSVREFYARTLRPFWLFPGAHRFPFPRPGPCRQQPQAAPGLQAGLCAPAQGSPLYFSRPRA